MSKSIAFDIGGTQCRAALFDKGKILARDQISTPTQDGPDAIVDAISSLMRRLDWGLLPTMVASTGQVANGCITAHNLSIMKNCYEFPLQEKLSKSLGRRVGVINDARAAAWGEYCFGGGKTVDDFLFLTVSTGVGAGVVLNRRLHLAKNGFDAEIGETLCADGRTLENHASGTALGELAQHYGFQSAKALCDAADQGNPTADRLYQDGIREIARKLADLAVMLGIQQVAVGGGVGLRHGYLDRLNREILQLPTIYRVPLVAASLGHDAGLYGAAALAQTIEVT